MSWANARPSTIVLDLADEGRARAERGEPDDGVGGRAARHFDGRTHGLVDRFGARLVDQRHGAFVHALLEQKILLGAGDHIDDRIADAENVVAGGGHGDSC